MDHVRIAGNLAQATVSSGTVTLQATLPPRGHSLREALLQSRHRAAAAPAAGLADGGQDLVILLELHIGATGPREVNRREDVSSAKLKLRM